MYKAYDSQSIYKDNANKKITGVCAGIARHYDLPRWQVRAVAVVGLILMPQVVGVAYLVGTVLLRTR